MEFSNRFIDDMTYPFRKTDNTQPYATLISSVTLDTNNIYNKSIIINALEDNIEIPLIARSHYENIIRENYFHDKVKKVEKIILPLYVNSFPQNKRTFNSIVKEFFTSVDYNKRLLKVITPSGETYYGGRGIILNKEFTPLLMCGIKARRVLKTDNYRGTTEKDIEYYRAFCRINPIVFEEPNNLINKGIIKKLIPLYTSIDIRFPQNGFTNNADSRKVEVIIDNFDKFFISPIKPTPSNNINETLNKCLNDNIEDILYF